MILEKETHKKFGYFSTKYSTNSNKKVVAKCNNCGKIREVEKRRANRLCVSCSQTGKHLSIQTKEKMSLSRTGEKHWNYGRTHSIESIKKMKKSHENPSKLTLKKMSNAAKKRIGEKASNWKGGKIIRYCLNCGTKFDVYPCRLQNGNGKFCSSTCVRIKNPSPKSRTKPEIEFERICKKHNLPYKYTGNGDFWIEDINPDFVNCNGKKVAIEIFGVAFHSPLFGFVNPSGNRTYNIRKTTLKKYGWESVIFWDRDIMRKDAEQFVLFTLKKEGFL